MPTMDLSELQAHIRALITLEETDAPTLSCYLSVGGPVNDPLPAFDRRVNAVRKVLRREEREPFEEALNHIKNFLANEVHSAAQGVAVFSRAGTRPFSLGLQFQVPLPDLLLVDSTPNIHHLVELKDTYHRYVVLITTEKWARILEVNLGAITEELWTARPELRERVGREWTQEHYQNHRRDRGERFLKEKIEVLEQLMSAGGHTHLILAGSPRLTARVRNCLPKHIAAKLVDTVSASANVRVDDVVTATLSSFVEVEQEESLTAVAQLVSNLRRGGLAVSATGPTLLALRRGQADVLVLATTYEPPLGASCRACGWIDAVSRMPAECPECTSAELRAVNLKEAMVKLAVERSTEVEFVRDSDTLMDLGGVGCLLRYAMSKQGMWVGSEEGM
ncbi:MAG: host attachment protein [Candidatus Eisenbacteria bacterium]|nr:host attachment protein [Candidatus Eisenbacteria bacterium]